MFLSTVYEIKYAGLSLFVVEKKIAQQIHEFFTTTTFCTYNFLVDKTLPLASLKRMAAVPLVEENRRSSRWWFPLTLHRLGLPPTYGSLSTFSTITLSLEGLERLEKGGRGLEEQLSARRRGRRAPMVGGGTGPRREPWGLKYIPVK